MQNRFHCIVTTGSAQRHDSSYEGLEELVKANVQDNTILLAFTNWGDAVTLFPDNLVHTMKKVGRTNYVLIATDNKAYKYLRCRGFHAFNDAPSFTGTKLTEKVSGMIIDRDVARIARSFSLHELYKELT